MPGKRRARAIAACALAAAALLAVSGCASSATPAAPPSLSTLTVTPDGITGLDVGLPVTSFALVNYGERACPSSGGWLPRYPQDEANSGGQELDPFDVNTRAASESGAITSEYVWSKALQTAKGIGVGSSLDDVLAAYPRAAKSKGYSTVMYAVPGIRGQLVIELAGHNDDAAGEWPVQYLDRVVWMDVIPKSAKVVSIASTVDAGPCPIAGHVPKIEDNDG